MKKEAFLNRFPKLQKIKESELKEIVEVRELTNLDEIASLVSKNWVLIATYNNTHGCVISLGRRG